MRPGSTNNTVVTVNNGGTLEMNGITDTVASLGEASGGADYAGCCRTNAGRDEREQHVCRCNYRSGTIH